MRPGKIARVHFRAHREEVRQGLKDGRNIRLDLHWRYERQLEIVDVEALCATVRLDIQESLAGS